MTLLGLNPLKVRHNITKLDLIVLLLSLLCINTNLGSSHLNPQESLYNLPQGQGFNLPIHFSKILERGILATLTEKKSSPFFCVESHERRYRVEKHWVNKFYGIFDISIGLDLTWEHPDHRFEFSSLYLQYFFFNTIFPLCLHIEKLRIGLHTPF